MLMPSWFSKVFENKATGSPTGDSNDVLIDPTLSNGADPHPAQRRVVDASVLTERRESAGEGDELQIRARVEPNGTTCLFMLNRPLLEGRSAWFPNPESCSDSPLADALFKVNDVQSITFHGANITVGRSPYSNAEWEPFMRQLGGVIRSHIEEGKPIISPSAFEGLPSEEAITAALQEALDREINPGVASHSGAIRLDRVEGNTVYIEMQGGCQGCAASDITLRQGIHQVFRKAVPQVGAILDVTDHSAGTNPFYTQLPAGM